MSTQVDLYGLQQHEIEQISNVDYYKAWVKIMEETNRRTPSEKPYPSFQAMIEPLLLIKPTIIEELVGALDRDERVAALHKEKLRSVLWWRRGRLQMGAAHYGLPN